MRSPALVLSLSLLVACAKASTPPAGIAATASDEGPADLAIYTLTGPTFDAIVEDPARWAGRAVEGEVAVGPVIDDGQGFWIESRPGDRLLAVLIGDVDDELWEITPGQTVHLSDAVVRRPSDLGAMAGRPLAGPTRDAAEVAPAFLAVDPSDVLIVDR